MIKTSIDIQTLKIHGIGGLLIIFLARSSARDTPKIEIHGYHKL